METLGKIFAFFIMLFMIIVIFFLQTYIIISIAGMYQLSFITKLSFMQVFGIMLIFKLSTYQGSKEQLKDTSFNTIKNGLTSILSTCTPYLLIWLIAYLIFLIVF
jgi:c-di-AMP phosphodiesterase-like protein